MTSGYLILPSIIDHNVMRLDRITLLPYRPLAGRYFFAAVPVQVFGLLLVVPADPAIEQLFAGILFAIPAVYVARVNQTAEIHDSGNRQQGERAADCIRECRCHT